MGKLKIHPRQSATLAANEPLHRRVPTRDEDGRLLSDFMVLIPGLRDWPKLRFARCVAAIQAALGEFKEVVFADLNVPLNLLWVSVKAEPGIISEVVGALQLRVPEARVVSPHRQV